MSRFLQDAADDDANAIAIPQVFSENSRAKNKFEHNFTDVSSKLRCDCP